MSVVPCLRPVSMMMTPVWLLFSAALAQNAPSIEDMLKDDSNTIHGADTGSQDPLGGANQGYGNSGVANQGFGNSANVGSSGNSGPSWGSNSNQGASGNSDPLGNTDFAPPKPVNQGASIGGLMGAMAGAMGKQPKNQSPDMFGRKPSSNPLGAMFGGGGGAAAGGAGGGGAKPNPLMDSLLSSIEHRMPANQKAAQAGGAPAPISQESKLIVSGLITEFMHKVDLAPGEKQCLDHNLATLTADVVGTAQDIVNAVKAIINGKQPGQGVHLRAKSQGTLVSAGLDAAMKLTSLATMCTGLLKNCVKGDALALLKKTGQRIINGQELGHRFLVSGVDIAHHLSAAINAYEVKDWKGFGAHIGVALRKILLSNSETGSRLPEGVPEEAIIQEATEGLMDGFFVRGSGVEITDQKFPDVDIQLDLHRCVAGNHEFFKEAWLAVWNLIAQLSVDGAKHGLKGMKDIARAFRTTNSDGSQPKWMGEIMIAMMQVPMALNRCNIGADTQQMFMEAIQSIKYVKVHFLFPNHKITADEATKRMAAAVESWTNWNFKDFGRQIGKLLREFVLLMYPAGGNQYAQQYTVDADGRLRRQLNERYKKSSLARVIKVGNRTFSTTFAAFSVGGVALTMLIGFVAVRGLRVMSRENYQDDSASDGNFLNVEEVE